MAKKNVVLLGDGMSDYPIDELQNKTPLEYAKTPNMDKLAAESVIGLAKTVPEGMDPGSDTANLSIFGYNPEEYFTGRSPLEALSMGISLSEKDAAFRCNIVSIQNETMSDFTAHHIETEFSKLIIAELAAAIDIKDIEFHAGVSYRHCIVWRNYPYKNITTATPPHDITSKAIEAYLPNGDGSAELLDIMQQARKVIAESKAIQSAAVNYQGTPSDVWIWGGGTRPAVSTLQDKYGITGHTISAVDLIHGIGIAAGLTPIHVPGATGYLDTDYAGKVAACKTGLEQNDFVFLHVEAPDESGHEGNIQHKLQAIEDFDAKVVGPVLELLQQYDDYAVIVMPDHPTPISLKTHSSDPVPFIYSNSKADYSGFKLSSNQTYSEKSAKDSGNYVASGHTLMDLLIKGRF